MSEPFLPYGRQFVDDDDVAAVEAVLRSDWLTTGPAVAEFESALAGIAGAPAVSVTSGTAALHVAYAALGIGAGDEVVTSPMTFVATASTAALLGAEVRFADVVFPGEELTVSAWKVDERLVLQASTPRAIVLSNAYAVVD